MLEVVVQRGEESKKIARSTRKHTFHAYHGQPHGLGHSLPAVSLIFVKFKTMPVCSFMSLNVAKQLSRSAGAAGIGRVLQGRIEACDDAIGDRRKGFVPQHDSVELAGGAGCRQPRVAIGTVLPHVEVDRCSCWLRVPATRAAKSFLRRSQGAQIDPRSALLRTRLRTCSARRL